MFGVCKGTFYYTKDCQHAKNEVFYVFGKWGKMCWTRLCMVWHTKA